MHRALLLAAPLLLSPALAAAHPHIFVSTGVEVIFDDQGRATALRISWTYDEMFSLMMVQENGLDPDGDNVLTQAELASLNGADMEWDPEFPGDTYALLGDAPLALSRPRDWTMAYDGAALTSTHIRDFDAPVTVAEVPLVVQSYDPGYYTAYTIDAEPVVTGRDSCTAGIWEPDRSKADAMLDAALKEYDGTDVESGGFPAVGAAYADEVRVTCAAPS